MFKKVLAGLMMTGVLVVFGVGGAACGGGAGSICDDVCDCEGCSDSEYDECIDTYEDYEREAEFEGCEDQYYEYTACISDEIECRDGRVDADGCGGPLSDFLRCMN